MFWVKIVLFFMSRRDDSEHGLVPKKPLHRPRMTDAPARQKGDLDRQNPTDNDPAKGSVTREEIQRLFGNALRVR